MISDLINKNRELHRQIDKLAGKPFGAASGTAERALRSLERGIRCNRAQAVRKRAIRGQGEAQDDGSATARAATAALTKAREAQAAKRAGAQP